MIIHSQYSLLPRSSLIAFRPREAIFLYYVLPPSYIPPDPLSTLDLSSSTGP